MAETPTDPKQTPASRGITRRRLIQAGALAGAGAALPFAATACGDDAEGGSDGVRNVVLVILDSVRPDFVGAYGSRRVQTPNIDALASKGLRFNRAFPEALVTVPARRSIYTGRRIFPYRNFEPQADLGVSPGWSPIDDLDRTVVKTLKDAGYRTVQVTDNPPIGFSGSYRDFRLSWDEWVSIEGRVGERNPPDTVSDREVRRWLPRELRENERYINGMKKNLANTGYGRDEEESDAARVFKEARIKLDELARGGKPFLLTVDCFDPHEPWSPTAEYIDMYGDPDYDGSEIGVLQYGPPDYLSTDELRRARACYAASTTMTDRWLGHFMDRFYELGLDSDTAVVFLSDHGFLLGERGWVGKIPNELHPELAQVPFIMVHPDDKAAGEVSYHFASTHDVAPTILSMLGLETPGWMEGQDLSVLFDGEQPPARDFHYGGMFNRYFVRTDQWLLLGDNLGGNRKLYDLTLDPGEWRDVERKNRKVGEELYQQLLAEAGPLPYYDSDELEAKIAAARERIGWQDPQRN
jgi:arylsulfatase A-like enzyme